MYVYTKRGGSKAATSFGVNIHSFLQCTGDNPLAKARGLFPRADGQTVASLLHTGIKYINTFFYLWVASP